MAFQGTESTETPKDGMSVIPGSRVRSSLAWLGSRRITHPEIEPVIRALRSNHPKGNLALVERAYETAARAHLGQFRKSGEPYITHPIAVATILAELGMTDTTVAAALLHDTVEDTAYSLEQCTRDFGAEIALLVDGVTKLDKVKYGDATQAETVRKMIVAMSKDIRVLLIKLADRLHNARTWKFVPAESAKKKAKETLEIYAPLAHRLGLNAIKWELEDRAFRTIYPGVYDEIEHLIAERAPAREEELGRVISFIEEDLRSSRIKGVVTGRPKHHYSIYQKMIVRGREFSDIYDLIAVRVLVDTVRDCYAVLGLMHARWNPMPGRFKDYIAMPKFNLYQSLHTTVIGPGGKPVEIQIRTHEMHRRAEYGVAAHWKYKENVGSKGSAPRSGPMTVFDGEGEMGWLRQLVEWQKEAQDPAEFLDSLRYEVASAEVYVFTPKGEVISLPAGSTPVDFAYSVHTEVGHRTVGARVNGRLVTLDTRLENGDTVEIFTSKNQNAGPSRDWLKFVKSPRAASKIKSWFSKERREEAAEAGKESIAKTLRKQNLPIQRLMNHESLELLAVDMGYKNIDGLYAAVGEGHISAQNVVDRLIGALGGEDGAEETLSEAVAPGRSQITSGSNGVVVEGMENDDVWIKLARCCTPVPGDQIIGFVTRGQGISVHQTDCPNAERLAADQPERIINVAWADTQKALFMVQVQIEALDRGGLLSDVTRVLSENHVNILSGNISTTRDRVAFSRWAFEMAEPEHLNHILQALRRIDGVYSAQRIGAKSQRSEA